MSDEFLGCVKAGKLFDLRPNVVHNAMRRGALTHIMVGKVRKTTVSWMREYLNSRNRAQNLRNKDGNRIYDASRGLYTVLEAAEKLGITRQLIYKYHYKEYIQLSAYEKFYIVTEQQLMQIQLVRETIRKKRKELYATTKLERRTAKLHQRNVRDCD